MADQVGGSARRTGDKARRLLELMNVLLGATTPVPVASIRSQVADYPPDDASFRRAFERDKVELRAMGVPLLVETIHDTDPPGIGYRIKLADWSLRDPGLDAEELEALRLASAAVGAEGGLGSRALYKLGAASAATARAEIPASGPVVEAFRGVLERRVLRFRYRDLDREVEPQRLEFVRGRWYLNGFDRTRQANRWFRVPRIQGDISAGEEAGAFERPAAPPPPLQLDPWELGEGEPVDARVWFDPAVRNTVLADLGDVVVLSDDDQGLVVRLPVRNREGFRTWVLSFLERAEVVGPPELRAEIVTWLEAVAGTAS